jgi:hypothetical protein
MIITKHAESRMAQRGVSRDLVKILWCYGRVRFANGAAIIDMDEEGISSYLRDDPASQRQAIDKLKKVYLVTVDLAVVTVARANANYKKKFH